MEVLSNKVHPEEVLIRTVQGRTALVNKIHVLLLWVRSISALGLTFKIISLIEYPYTLQVL